MKPEVFIINGLGGCGKSTFIQYCKQYRDNLLYYTNNYSVFELSTIDPVKDIARYCGWDGSKTQKDRVFLYELKEILTKWKNIPTLKTFEKIDIHSNNIYFVNIRESKNIETFQQLCQKNHLNCHTIIIKNPNKISNEVPQLVNEINSFQYDFVILNDKDLISLKETADSFIKTYIKED